MTLIEMRIAFVVGLVVIGAVVAALGALVARVTASREPRLAAARPATLDHARVPARRPRAAA